MAKNTKVKPKPKVSRRGSPKPPELYAPKRYCLVAYRETEKQGLVRVAATFVDKRVDVENALDSQSTEYVYDVFMFKRRERGRRKPCSTAVKSS